jgi:predicted ATPase
MPFLTEVHFQNYRSFLDAKCRLSPVTAVIGANNAGKSNLLKGIRDLATAGTNPLFYIPADFADFFLRKEGMESLPTVAMLRTRENEFVIENRDVEDFDEPGWKYLPIRDDWRTRFRGGLGISRVGYYVLEANKIGIPEPDAEKPSVHTDGEGVTRVLQMLSLRLRKTFQRIEEEFREFVAEIEELSFERAEQGKWFIQVKEHGIEEPVSLSEMSEGTRTILALLTIIHQPNRPELILLEDIEHAIHPRGLAPLVETMRRMAKEHGVQFIFTTQSPYVLDCFQKPEYWDDVVIVEKKDGVSTLTNAKDRLVALGYEREMENLPLGDLWYSGALGGVAGPNELWDEPQSKS